MSPQELNALHVLHVGGVLTLIGYTFYAFAAAADTRKRVMVITGIANLLVLATGVRLWQGVFGFHAFGWIVIKLLCWLGVAAMAGIAYRKRELAGVLIVVTLALAITAVAMVYVKPF